MPNYFVRFIAHIDERKRPEGFPREIYVDETYENVEGAQQVRQMANQRFLQLAMSNGLVSLKKQETMEQELVTFDKRVYVPWHMITHMHMKVTQLVEVSDVKAPDPIAPEDTPPDKPTAQVN
jgi:hypothetical protein